MTENNQGPARAVTDSRPLEGDRFRFACHAGIDCFTRCCCRLDLRLYPYDVVRLKQALAMGSEEFMRRHTGLGQGSHPSFPAVMLLMADNEERSCPFLGAQGCIVYADRPSACRTYPLERAVEKSGTHGRLKEHWFVTNHAYCHGHAEEQVYTVRQWVRDQRLHEFNLMNDLWAEVDALFATKPWQGEGAAGPRQQMAFMACYNIDGFRAYAKEQRLLESSGLDRDRRRHIERDDAELLKFAFEWLLKVLGG